MLGWFLFWFLAVPLLFLLLLSLLVHYILQREKRDTTFADKMNRFRDRVEQSLPSKQTREALKVLLGMAIMVWLLFFTGYTPDDP